MKTNDYTAALRLRRSFDKRGSESGVVPDFLMTTYLHGSDPVGKLFASSVIMLNSLSVILVVTGVLAFPFRPP